MAMRSVMTAGLIWMLAGCPRPVTANLVIATCPDPKNCTASNGTGVYTAEDGFAGFGTSQLMITHFINTGSSVMFQGRYLNKFTKNWQMLSAPGIVRVGSFHQEPVNIISVAETSTVPTWTLRNVAGQVRTAAGDDLLQLLLFISFNANDEAKNFAIDFVDSRVIQASANAPPISVFSMRWRDVANPAQITPYCLDADHQPDPVVFQRGIDVDPVFGQVMRSPANPEAANFVTMSCYQGALATAYGWGYDYLTNPFYFDAAIQMKRASYCGDAAHYTVANTKILMRDDAGINHEPINNDPINWLEASWSPAGAICVNLGNMRHRGTATRPGFNGFCGQQELRPCGALVKIRRSPFLFEGPEHPAP